MSFTTTSSYATFDTAGFVNSNSKGFDGGTFDGRYVYLAPNNNGASFGQITRYDTTLSFTTTSSYATFDTTGFVTRIARASSAASSMGAMSTSSHSSMAKSRDLTRRRLSQQPRVTRHSIPPAFSTPQHSVHRRPIRRSLPLPHSLRWRRLRTDHPLRYNAKLHDDIELRDLRYRRLCQLKQPGIPRLHLRWKIYLPDPQRRLRNPRTDHSHRCLSRPCCDGDRREPGAKRLRHWDSVRDHRSADGGLLVSGPVYANSGISFNNGATTISFYTENGTWTPTIAGSTSAGIGTYTTQVGNYQQIGIWSSSRA